MEPQTSTNSWFTCHQSIQLLESHECDILLPGVLFTSGFSVVKVQYLARKVRSPLSMFDRDPLRGPLERVGRMVGLLALPRPSNIE